MKKNRNPQMNNTHTSGLIKDKKVLGINNYRTGMSTPSGQTGNILERSQRSINNNIQLEESKITHLSDSQQMPGHNSYYSQTSKHSDTVI